MTTKELQATIVENMRRWQKIEDASVVQTSEIIAKTTNPLIRMVMEIIRADSERHYRVQELIAKSLETETMVLSPDELAEVWTMIEKHIDMEKKAEAMAEESLAALKGRKMLVQEYLLNYLVLDEAKHDQLLENLEKIKEGMYPYA
jgi:DNA-binding transcriptional MocR family regulator